VTVRTFTALVNPVSGGGTAAQKWAPLAARLAAAGADVRVELTRSRTHAVEAAAGASADGRVVVAVGGDGLVRDVAQGVVASGGTMGIVPAGRGNDLARRLGLPGDVAGLAALLLQGAGRPTDVIALGDTIVVGNVYCGIDSVANAIINANRRVPALLVYRVAPLRAVLSWRAPTFTLTVDGRDERVAAHIIVVGNSGQYGHGLRIVPSAEVDDGRLDVLVVGAGPKRDIAAFMRAAQRGTHVRRPDVRVLPGREITLDADRPVPVCGDGEYLAELPVTLRVRPGALNLLRP
jgi:diacylglycerol kinase (ATP)